MDTKLTWQERFRLTVGRLRKNNIENLCEPRFLKDYDESGRFSKEDLETMQSQLLKVK